MSDHFKYFLKPEERKSYEIKKKPTRKWNVILVLGNVALLLLIFFLVYRPAMEKLNKENRVFINEFSIDIEYEMTENGIFIDLYIFNNGIKQNFDFSKLFCSIVLINQQEVLPINNKTDIIELDNQKGIHDILTFIPQNKINKGSGFFIRIKYDDKIIYESKKINYTY